MMLRRTLIRTPHQDLVAAATVAFRCRQRLLSTQRRLPPQLLRNRRQLQQKQPQEPRGPRRLSSSPLSSSSPHGTGTQHSSSSSAAAATASSFTSASTAAIAAASLAIGFTAGHFLGRNNDNNNNHRHPMVLPNGLPRTCCDEPERRPEHVALGQKLTNIVGDENVLDGTTASGGSSRSLQAFCKGARIGHGQALYVVTPHSLTHVVDCVQAIVDADCVVLPQGQNTGLTGGSVPHLTVDKRPTVILSMKYLNRIFPIDDGQRVVCLAGVGLAQLQDFLAENFPTRESHCTLGSTFLNPTTAAGVAFGSGGTQVRKGPAYTERVLYLKVSTNKWQENIVQVINTLGIQSMVDADLPEERARKMDKVPYLLDTWSRWIQQGLRDMKYSDDNFGRAPAHDVTYRERVCQLNEEVSRFNADTRGLEPNRSEGKLVILATVHDTFEKPKRTKTFWIAMDSLETALELRREVCLDNPRDLPISVEYLNKDSYEVIDRSGRLMAFPIRWLGPASPFIRQMWNAKLMIEALPIQGADLVVDKFLHLVNPLVPSVLPRAIRESASKLDHHVAMTVGDFGDGEMDRLLNRLDAFAANKGSTKVAVHDCSNQAAALTAFRFIAAPAFRTWCVGEGTQGISVDYALPKNDGRGPVLDGVTPLKRMRYSHFGCNVVHEDLAYAPGVDVEAAKHDLKAAVETKCGGRLPAEHGHGTEYVAPKETQERWMKMDPLNVLNPGVGGLSEKRKYQE